MFCGGCGIIWISGIGAVVARTPGGREVASSSLVSQTTRKIRV